MTTPSCSQRVAVAFPVRRRAIDPERRAFNGEIVPDDWDAVN
jgi:hypothetical protein